MRNLNKNIDFGWSMLLLVVGMIFIAVAKTIWNLSISDILTSTILWITAVAIFQYTLETRKLTWTEIENLKFQKAPFVIVHFEIRNLLYSFILKNVGRGVACNVEWKVIGAAEGTPFPKKTIIAPDERFTRITNSLYKILKPSRESLYEICVEYENLDGIKYYTKLKSGKTIDDYEVLDYGELK